MKLEAKSVGKYFAEKKIFRDISFDVESGNSIAITGPNGSGKTTLIRILCGLINPTEGKVIISENGQILERQYVFAKTGLVGPYLELYQELTAMENLMFFARLKRLKDPVSRILYLFKKFGLEGRENDLVKAYSSGMKQRLKYVFALLSEPQILFLDEPTSNLDSAGMDVIYELMEKQKKHDILVIATNDKKDLKFGDKLIAVAS